MLPALCSAPGGLLLTKRLCCKLHRKNTDGSPFLSLTNKNCCGTSVCRQGALPASEGLQQGPAQGLLLKPPQKAVQWDMLWGLVTWRPL